jgi:large subunit ribosomal protein L13
MKTTRENKKAAPAKAKQARPRSKQKKEEQPKRWVIFDAKDQVLGRIASEIAKVLRGKDNPSFSTHEDMGSFVVVINAGKVRLTGNKWSKKMYYNYSGYVGGLKERNAEELHEKHPTDLIQRAVRGMLPRGPLGYRIIKKLKVYEGSEHPHVAQKPDKI